MRRLRTKLKITRKCNMNGFIHNLRYLVNHKTKPGKACVSPLSSLRAVATLNQDLNSRSILTHFHSIHATRGH